MTTSKSSPVERAIRSLRERGVPMRQPANPVELQRVETRLRGKLPHALLSFYLEADGMAPGVMDPVSLIRVWPASEMVSVASEQPELLEADGWILFADYSLWAHGYAVQMNQGAGWGRIAIVGGPELLIQDHGIDRFLADFYGAGT